MTRLKTAMVETFHARLSVEERKLFEDAAKKLGVSLTDFARGALVGRAKEVLLDAPTKETAKILDVLGGMEKTLDQPWATTGDWAKW